MNKTDRFLKEVAACAPEYGPIPFWSWNDRLEEGELRRQVRRMHDLGMHGFFMHARGGLKTPYLGDEWFAAVNACVDEAEKCGMEAWAYDENGWPSGFAGGALLAEPDDCMTGLILREGDTFPKEKDVLAVYVLEEGRARRVTAPEEGAHYYGICRALSNSYVDTLNPAVTRKFIEKTHEVYRARVTAGAFGGRMPGFFTDEPQYNRWNVPYSDTLPAEFARVYGYDLFDGLPALFLDCEGCREFRYDYYKLCGEMFAENFLRPIHEWCTANGCRLTGHGVEEFSLAGQILCCGSIMPMYEYEDMPGMDYLGREVRDDLGGRQLGSACAQFGKKKALSEMFACCGWDVSPRELKRLADSQYVNGVNVMCQHLYPYTEHGQRKRDYPAHYSEHLPWQDELRDFNRYFTHLGAFLSRGEEDVHTLIIHPVHAAYMSFLQKEGWRACRDVSAPFMALVGRLSANGLPYHLGEENLMKKYARVEGDALRVGKCLYDTVILPEMDSLDESTAALLRAYLAAGGKLALAGAAPTRINARKSDGLAFLRANTTIDDILAAAPVRYGCRGDDGRMIYGSPEGCRLRQMVRRTEAGLLIYLCNTSPMPCRDLTLEVRGVRGLVRVDMDTLEARPVPGRVTDGVFRAMFDLDDSEGALFLESEKTAGPAAAPSRDVLRLTNRFRFTETPQNALTLDRFAVARGDGPFSDEQPIERIREELLLDRYAGDVTLRAVFTAKEMPRTLSLAMERAAYRTLTVNGHPVTLTPAPHFPKDLATADILPLVHPGENEVCFTLPYFQREETYYALFDATSEALRNCIAYDGEVECIYLFGAFRVKTDPAAFRDEPRNACRYTGTFALCAPKERPDMRDLTRDGYPFFCGEMRVETTLAWRDGDPTVLSLPGRYALCRVSVNGQAAGMCFFSDKVDVAPYLRAGENRVTLTLVASPRNLLGPHHCREAEPYGVSPDSFSFRGAWKDGRCDAFVPAYAFVRFGLDG